MKTAIRINNKEEYDMLMVYLDQKGWKWITGISTSTFNSIVFPIPFIVLLDKYNVVDWCVLHNFDKDEYNLITIEKFMNNFKKGQTIEMTGDCGDFKKGTIHKLEMYKDELATEYIENYHCTCNSLWKLVTKDWTNLEVGDVIITEFNTEKTVLEIGLTRSAFLLSLTNEKDIKDGWWTTKEMENAGWKIKDTTPEEEMIDIEGKSWSLSTIKEALKKHLG